MKRYSKPEVDGAVEETERHTFSPHSQMVLAGEVLAMRLQERAACRCQRHGVMLYTGSDGQLECWYCNERGRMERGLQSANDLIRSLQSALKERDDELNAARREGWILHTANGPRRL